MVLYLGVFTGAGIVMVYFIAFMYPLFYALGNMVDSDVANSKFKNPFALFYYCVILNFLMLPLFFIFGVPDFASISSSIIPLLIITLVMTSLRSIPYYFALKKIDVSIVSALYELSKIIAPILAFFFLRETLTPAGYFGFGLIIFALVVLNFDPSKKLKLNVAFWIMCLAAVLWVVSDSMVKVCLGEVDWLTFLFLDIIAAPFIVSLLMLDKKLRGQVKQDFLPFKRYFKYLVYAEVLYFIGGCANFYALERITFLEMQAISGTQSIFILVASVAVSLFASSYSFKEKTDFKSVIKKAIFLCMVIIGVLLVLFGGYN